MLRRRGTPSRAAALLNCMSLFGNLFAEAATPILKEIMADSAKYVPPEKDTYQSPINVKYVTVSDLRSEIRMTEIGEVTANVRYFSICIDPTNPKYCGHSDFKINSRFEFLNDLYLIDERTSANGKNEVYRCEYVGRIGTHNEQFYGTGR